MNIIHYISPALLHDLMRTTANCIKATTALLRVKISSLHIFPGKIFIFLAFSQFDYFRFSRCKFS